MRSQDRSDSHTGEVTSWLDGANTSDLPSQPQACVVVPSAIACISEKRSNLTLFLKKTRSVNPEKPKLARVNAPIFDSSSAQQQSFDHLRLA